VFTVFDDDRYDGNGMSDAEDRPGRRRPRTMAESLGIPPAVGRRARAADEGSRDPDDEPIEVPSERRSRRGSDRAGAAKQLEAAEEALEKARAESRENAEKYVRVAAEMDNLRKRYRQERASQLQYANSELISKLLPVVDNFHRALEHAPGAAEDTAPQEWVAGLNMVLRQLEDMLAAEGVTVIDAVGQDFDPSRHQAVLAEPSDEHDEGKVIEEMQRGYMLHDRVIRPSMVKVARNS
jgi:molecular chaperone GrpE